MRGNVYNTEDKEKGQDRAVAVPANSYLAECIADDARRKKLPAEVERCYEGVRILPRHAAPLFATRARRSMVE
jgi:hypothetical protein